VEGAVSESGCHSDVWMDAESGAVEVSEDEREEKQRHEEKGSTF
jgi:hypothetical protein